MDDLTAYRLKQKKIGFAGVMIAVVLLCVMLISVGMGSMQIPVMDVLQIIKAHLTGSNLPANIPENVAVVVWEIRLPRILSSALVGMGLATAGAVFQSLLVNPLADPYTLGVSTGAAFGAALSIYLNFALGLFIPATFSAFLVALCTLLLVIGIAHRSGGMLSSNLVIAGIIVSSILSSGLSFLKMIAGENVSAIVFWLMGSLSSQNWQDVRLLVPVLLVCGLVCFLFAGDLNVMTMGEENASSLGVNTKLVRFIYLVAGSCITAVCVAVSGIIGFVGLVVPHILRFWLTPDNRALIPLSALLGALLLCLADSATRLLFAGEIPVGVLTTLLGGPFFIFVFLKRRAA